MSLSKPPTRSRRHVLRAAGARRGSERKIFDLTEALIRRGYADDDIAAVLGGNFRRLLAATWK